MYVHTKSVYSLGVHKTSFHYRCTQNRFTVQVYTKQVYSTGVHKPVSIKAAHKTKLEHTFEIPLKGSSSQKVSSSKNILLT